MGRTLLASTFTRLAALTAVALALAVLPASDTEATEHVLGPYHPDPVWPVSGTTTPDYNEHVFSSTFGPRLKASEDLRYDFHRGIDIPCDCETPLHAIADGVIRLAGDYSFYSDRVVQIRHYKPGSGGSCTNEDGVNTGCYYSNYLHLTSVAENPETGQPYQVGDSVQKGDVIAYSGESGIEDSGDCNPNGGGFNHLHFEIREGGINQRHTIHPLQVLPYPDTGASSLALGITSVDAAASKRWDVAASVTLPQTVELDLNRVEVTVYDSSSGSLVQVDQHAYDMYDWNFQFSLSQMDDPDFNGVTVVPARFNARSSSYDIAFTFRRLRGPADAADLQVKVTAADIWGNAVTVVSGGAAPTGPGAPTGVTATAGDGEATVSFSPPASDGGSAITSYTVTASPGGRAAIGAASPLTVGGLTNGTSYTFTVTATNTVGTGPASALSNAVTPATLPGAPTGVTATAGDGEATVSFSPPASDGGSPITSYTVTASPGGRAAIGAASPLTVGGLTNETSYTFTVTATNTVGTGPASALSNAVTPTTLAGAPTVSAITTLDRDGDGKVDGATVVFSEAVDDSTFTPANWSIGGAAVEAITTAGTADDATLQLEINVDTNEVAGTAVQDVLFTAGTGTDLAGNALASVLSGTVAEADGAAPVFSAASVNGTGLILTFGESLDGASVPATGDFSIGTNGAAQSVTGVVVGPSTVTLTLSPGAANGNTITVSYTAAANPLRDAATNAASNLSDQAVTNNTPAVPGEPASISAVVTYTGVGGKDQRKHVVVTVSLTADDSGAPVAGATVSLNLEHQQEDATWVVVSSQTLTTDENGTVSYRLTNADPGDYSTVILSVVVDGQEPTVTTMDDGYTK